MPPPRVTAQPAIRLYAPRPIMLRPGNHPLSDHHPYGHHRCNPARPPYGHEQPTQSDYPYPQILRPQTTRAEPSPSGLSYQRDVYNTTGEPNDRSQGGSDSSTYRDIAGLIQVQSQQRQFRVHFLNSKPNCSPSSFIPVESCAPWDEAGPSRPIVELSSSVSSKLSYQRSHISTAPLANLDQARNRDRPLQSVAHIVCERLIHLTVQSQTSEEGLYCPHCGAIPLVPITGACGHSRCHSCVEKYGKCPCGEETVWTSINVLQQKFMDSLLPRERTVIGIVDLSESQIAASENPPTALRNSPEEVENYMERILDESGRVSFLPFTIYHSSEPKTRWHEPSQARYRCGRDLAEAGLWKQAAPHLVRAAAFGRPYLAKRAKDLLIQVLEKLSDEQKIWQITEPLQTSPIRESSINWFTSGDLECILCYKVFRNPVTTPCGHTFCRPCIERCMDFRWNCPLCNKTLENFNVASTGVTQFLVHAIEAAGASADEQPDYDDRLPLFVCTVAFPTLICPLYVFEPRYRLMIRRCMKTKSRHFGMVYGNGKREIADFGTVLEIRDCVQLEDGNSLLTTVGVSRFKILEKDECDGYDVARVAAIYDIDTQTMISQYKYNCLHDETRRKAERWLGSMEAVARAEIESSFGPMPPSNYDMHTYEPDGPAWVWWLLAILPLRNEIKVLILSELDLTKRLVAIQLTLNEIHIISKSFTSVMSPRMPNARVQRAT